MKHQEAARLTHQSLERGLRILEVIAASGGLINLATVGRRTGLHRSTTHHLLQTLVALGYLRQDATTRGYELSAKLFKLTGRTWTPEQLGVVGHPIVTELARLSGEGASLAAYRDGIVRIVTKCDADGPVRVVQDIGAERPIHAAAVGKAIAAFLPPAELTGLLDRLRLDRYAPKTIVARAKFEAELRRIRSVGYATDDEEHIEGIRCIAAPIFSYTGQVVASLCAVGPKSRMTRQKLRDLRPPLRALAQALSERLGVGPDAAARRNVA
ncbi:MAG TPA: IclR family transcriptional regulator [Xanthobacteraceae bacterium]